MKQTMERNLLEKTLFDVLRWRSEGKNISITLYEDINGWDDRAFEIQKMKADDIFPVLEKNISGIRFGIKYTNPKFGDPSSIGIQMQSYEFGGVSVENDELVIIENEIPTKYPLR